MAMPIIKTAFPIDNSGTLFIAESPGGRLFVTASASDPPPSRGARPLFDAILSILQEKAAVPIQERIFASSDCADNIAEERRRSFAEAALDAATFIHGASPHAAGFAGVIVHAARKGGLFSTPKTATSGDRIVGRRLQSSRNDYLILQNLGQTVDRNTGPERQTEQLLLEAHRAVSEAGFEFHHVVRTWFYLKDILNWYGEFNRVRSAAYNAYGIMPTAGKPLMLPASTGIEGQNASGSALTADFLLVRPLADMPSPLRLRNPVQKEAFQYGASFSRAARIEEEGETLIEISGTAAIDEQGRSLYPGDAASQISCTLDKIEALLSTANASLHDIVSACVFVKHPVIAPLFRKEAARRGLEAFPAIVVRADVCRDDLLFEIDAEALTAG